MLVAMITSSFDIFLVINVGPNLRFTQLIVLFTALLIFLYEKDVKFKYPPFIHLLFLFFILNLFFVINSGYLPKGIGYAGWLLFNILTVFMVNYVVCKTSKLEKIIKYYVLTFVFISIFCFLQFIAGFLGYGETLFVTTWWIPNRIARLNGFSYEPSFLAAYLITGWSFLAWLNYKKVFLFRRSTQFSLTLILAFAILLSGSRLGVIFILLFYVLVIVKSVIQVFYKMKLPRKISLITPLPMTIAFSAILSVVIIKTIDYRLMLMGLGIGQGASSNSVSIRAAGFNTVIDLFMKNPFSGVSLGGLSYHIAKQNGTTPTSFASSKIEGNGVILEIFAATGIFGGLLFVAYLVFLAFSAYTISKKLEYHNRTILLAALVSLFMLWMIIQPNQNVLRPYLWVHIGFLSGLMNYFRSEKWRM